MSIFFRFDPLLDPDNISQSEVRYVAEDLALVMAPPLVYDEVGIIGIGDVGISVSHNGRLVALDGYFNIQGAVESTNAGMWDSWKDIPLMSGVVAWDDPPGPGIFDAYANVSGPSKSANLVQWVTGPACGEPLTRARINSNTAMAICESRGHMHGLAVLL